ncbi:MAG TPA: DoxX family protein [Gemmatimonadaceae bacterium]|nr:DoxX family protein [Gemmatimonadaceae bacterium]
MFDQLGLIHFLLLAALLIALYAVRRAIPGSGLQAWHDRHTSPRANARWHRVLALEIVELTLAGIFLLVGGAKLIGRPDMVALFQQIGFGQWFRYATGAVEVAGAALLLIPILSAASASLLGVVMIVATLVELFVLHRPPVAALACLSGHTYVAWARVSGRHHRWLNPEHKPHRPRLVRGTLPIAGRWNFRRVNASRRVHRQPALHLGE